MVFLKRANGVYTGIAQKTAEIYQSDVIDRIALSRKVFKKQFLSDSHESSKLVLESPVQFIYKYLNSDVVDNALKVNPNISKILNDNCLSVDYNLDNVKSIIASHLLPCARLVSKIYYNISRNYGYEDYMALIQAALLHDIGKIFIPESILNKKGRLTPKERLIVELHNRLSYEILITTDLKPQVARLAWEHHDYDNCFRRTKENQALMIADVYCALREVRPYKKALNDLAAKTILYDMGASGKFDVGYVKYINC